MASGSRACPSCGHTVTGRWCANCLADTEPVAGSLESPIEEEAATQATQPEPVVASPPSFCAQCGVGLSTSARFCPNCGVEISSVTPPPSATASTAQQGAAIPSGLPPPSESEHRSSRSFPKWILAMLAVVAILAIVLDVALASRGSGQGHDALTRTLTTSSASDSSVPPAATSEASIASSPPSTTTTPKPTMTVSQANAVASAKQYLQTQAFSRAGLVKQLSSKYGEGFSKADAVYAVNHIKVNWNQEAVKSAKHYLSQQPFSRDGLIQQLESKYGESFTHAQAVYGVDHTGL